MKDIHSIAESGSLFDGRYKLLRPLSSEGGTADVWLALDTNTIDEVYNEQRDVVTPKEDTGIQVAIKIYRPKNALDFGEQLFRDEFKIVFNCHHTNLVQPINFSIYEGIPYLVLPFCQKGSSETLQSKITDRDELWRYISDVSAGLAYLHAFNPTIVHHDIKPANVLIDDSGNFAITDFGISSHRGLNREGYDSSQSGTLAYMAPERFKEDYESMPESDMWSFGATLYELITGRVPFGEDGGMAQVRGETCSPIKQQIDSDIKKLIYDCLSADPSKRPSAAYVNMASQSKHYPIRHTAKYIISGLVAAAIIGISISYWLSPEPVKPRSNQEIYDQAMALINTDDPSLLKKGLAIMDSLGAAGYVPAIYEQAFTYGWYSDSASVARKELLGIELYPSNTTEAFLPISHQVNNKAIGLFTRIEEYSDSTYPHINAKALYRLACYYVNPNKVFMKNDARGERLLKQARQWAVMCNDTAQIRRIDRGLRSLTPNGDY